MNPVQQSYADEVTRRLQAAGRSPRRPIEFRSQHGEDMVLWSIFHDQFDGFYIEVGAFDGKSLAVSYWLDCIGWNGLLIEAIPERYAECVQNRPDARVVHAALGPPGQSSTVAFTVTDDHWGGMLSSVGKGIAPGDVPARKVEVPFTTMDELLKDHRGDVDVAVIDVEGFEVPLLQGFNLKKHKPKVLLLEDCGITEDAVPESAISRYMKLQPYVQVGIVGNNRVYARRDLAREYELRIHGTRQ